MNDFWNDFSRTLHDDCSANMFYFAIDYENEANMKVAATNVNIKINHLSFKMVSAWPLHSGKPQGAWHEPALEWRVDYTCDNDH